jgi:L-asparaginase II
MEPPAGVEDRLAKAAITIRDAMRAYPYLVAGRDRFDTALMQIESAALLAKGGASGVQCVGIPGGFGLAVKIEDGAGASGPIRPGAVVAVEALRQSGSLDDAAIPVLDPYARPPVRTVAGRVVGKARPVFALHGLVDDRESSASASR